VTNRLGCFDKPCYSAVMTKLEEFVTFAKRLPKGRRFQLDEILSGIMATMDDKTAFTNAELAELDKRMANPNPEFASDAEIKAVFGKSFS